MQCRSIDDSIWWTWFGDQLLFSSNAWPGGTQEFVAFLCSTSRSHQRTKGSMACSWFLGVNVFSSTACDWSALAARSWLFTQQKMSFTQVQGTECGVIWITRTSQLNAKAPYMHMGSIVLAVLADSSMSCSPRWKASNEWSLWPKEKTNWHILEAERVFSWSPSNLTFLREDIAVWVRYTRRSDWSKDEEYCMKNEDKWEAPRFKGADSNFNN